MPDSRTNLELIAELVALRAQVEQCQGALSHAYGAYPDDHNDSLLLNEAGVALNGALTAAALAIEKVAAFEGLQRAGIAAEAP